MSAAGPPPSGSRRSASAPSDARRAARPAVLDARRPGHEHQAAHQVRPAQGQVEADAGAHRVPEVVGDTADVAEQGGGAHQVGADRCRRPVSRQVHQHDLVVVGQVVGQAAPHPAGLGEPVGQHQPATRAVVGSAGDGVQGGGGHRRCP